MRSPFTAICLLTTILTSSVSAGIFGYDCSGKNFFIRERLEDVRNMAIFSARFSEGDRKLSERFSISKYYNGPPFTKSYLLWPITPHKTGDYEMAARLPFRAVLNHQLEVISVIELIGQKVKECQVFEWTTVDDSTHEFSCGINSFSDSELKAAIDAACPMTREIARNRFPARYTGPIKGRTFIPNGSQLYIFPLEKFKIYKPNDEPGSIYVVFNSHCKLETVVTETVDTETEEPSYVQCDERIKRARKKGSVFARLGNRVNPQ